MNGGLKRRSVSCLTLEQATYVNPQENSFFPTSITTLSSVSPWDLWMVTAQASLRGSCKREHCTPELDHVRLRGVMGTVPSWRVGPE